MHNTYISSTISVRSKGSLSFSFNDYSYYINERFDKTPSSCCSCCALCVHRVPINPSLLFGLRQSTLIQWSASRRLILGGGDRYCYRVPVYGLDRGCYGVTCCLKERSVGGKRERRGKGRFGCKVLEEESEWRGSVGVVDAEVMLSLLTEEVGAECFGVRERNCSASNRVGVEKRGKVVDKCFRGRKKNVGSGSMGSKSKCESESVTIKTREEDCGGNEEREAFSRGENRKARKGGSSCSSYYSFSSSGDFESDTEVQVKHGGVVGESSNLYMKDLRRDAERRFDGEVVEEIKRHRDHAEEHGEGLKQRSTAVGSGVEWDLRKKSEKKLTEVSLEQTKTRKESSQTYSRVSGVHERVIRASDSHKKCEDREEKLTLAGNLDDETRKQYTQVPEIHGSDVETISSSQKRFSGRKENLSAAVNVIQETKAEDRGKCERITGKDESRRNSQQSAQMSKNQDVNIERASNLQRQSDSRMKNWEEKSSLVLSSVQEVKEQHHRTGERIIGQVNSGESSQQFSDISEIHESDVEMTSTSHRQSEGRMENREGSLNFIFTSHPDVKEHQFQTDRKDIRRTGSQKGSQDMTNISVVHDSDAETVTNSQGASEKRMSSQESYLMSTVKLIEGTRYRHNETDERVMQIGSRKEAQRLTKLLSSHESTSEEASGIQASLDLVSQSRVQKSCADEGDNGSSQAIVMPPASQLVARGSLHSESTSGFAALEVSKETSENVSSSLSTHLEGNISAPHHEPYGRGRRGETYWEPLNVLSHEDALGSADRLEKSSMQFVGEFVEKARHEVSTSEIQKKKKLSKTKLVYEGEKQMQKGFSYGSEDTQLKEQDSRHSSGGSGTKGPSDEMWDVTDSSLQGPPKSEAPEATTTTGNAIVRGTGRSLWGIIADIVRMRWGSHGENHTSAVKLGGKSSSNESVSSEAWFSGHDPDENIDENVKRGKIGMVLESTSADQSQLGKTHTLSQREGSDTMSSKGKIGHVEVDTSSSSTFLESGLAFQGISSTSGEELALNESGKSFQGTPSSTPIVESSLPLSARQIRRSPAVEEIVDTGKADVSGSSSLEQMEQPLGVRLTEVSGTEGKDGELKRRKLQRNKQVLKDRFEEWEDAYKLESEQRKIDEMFMREALLEAKKAADSWEVPVGAVLVQQGKIIARGCNLVEELRDSTAHAEMMCIREASNLLQTWRLAETTLYVTLEPCPMCAGAILQARIETLVWGAPNKLLGADGSWIRLFPNGGEGGNGSELTDKPPAPVHPFHPKMMIRRGVLASECADVMQQFFQLRRRKKEMKPDPPTPPSCLPIAHRPSKFLTKMHEIFNTMFCL
ncbi:hypothetical protein L1049_006877 [Liquidambar formosana]|uniref:tRNA(adenine(34)) deaminase n=1 Tax=Liquidambar formosana TaxID=63359 RepID=A0AAP0RJI1_LIQFO